MQYMLSEEAPMPAIKFQYYPLSLALTPPCKQHVMCSRTFQLFKMQVCCLFDDVASAKDEET